MKVLIVNKFLRIVGGSERYIFTLSELLKREGIQTCFFGMEDENNDPETNNEFLVKNNYAHGNLIQKIRLVKNMNYSKEAYKKMNALIEKEKPDLAILNLFHKNLTCSIIDALYEKKIPIIWVCHDLMAVCPSYLMLNGKGEVCEKCINGDFKNCFKQKCVRGSSLLSYLSYREAEFIKKHKFYDKIDLIITPSLFFKKKIESSKLIHTKVVHLCNPCLNEPVKEINKNPENYFLYLGRLSKEKGIDLLIKAFTDIDSHLHIVGKGQEKNNLRKLTDELSLNNKVKFLGFKSGDELNKIIYNSKVVVLPSQRYENGPYSAIEALSMGKPLIVSSYGGLPELIDQNGYIFNSEEELNEILSRLSLISQDEYKLLCSNSLNKYMNSYYKSDYVQKLFDLYKEINK